MFIKLLAHPSRSFLAIRLTLRRNYCFPAMELGMLTRIGRLPNGVFAYFILQPIHMGAYITHTSGVIVSSVNDGYLTKISVFPSTYDAKPLL